MMNKLAVLFLLASSTSTGRAANITNPSGSCSDDVDPFSLTTAWFSPGPDDVYLQDCQLTDVNREYWKVFARTDAEGAVTAYVMPRPYVAGLDYGFCTEDTSATSDDVDRLFRKYQLCQETVTDGNVINNMEPADALQITHLLHSKLSFKYGDGGRSIVPFAYDEDVIAACEILAADTASHPATYFCESIKNRCNADGMCTEEGILPSQEAVEIMVPALNQLYGIDIGSTQDTDDTPAAAITNPSGSCSDGVDPSSLTTTWFSPGPDIVYLQDCQLTDVSREYWKVFARTDAEGAVTAAVLPRPDGAGLNYGFCTEGSSVASDDVDQLFRKYQLCQETVTDVNVINNMEPADALQITRLLHSKLGFKIGGGGDSIVPFAYDEDVIAACEILAAGTANHPATPYCGSIRSRCNADGICNDIGIIPSQEAVEALVPALNQLYGIDTDGNPDSAAVAMSSLVALSSIVIALYL